MNSRGRALLMTSVLALLALGGLAAALLGAKLLNLPAPLVSEQPGRARPATPARRTLMVVLDGLRADTARTLPTLTALAQRGTSLNVWSDTPTFSAPQYVSLLAGVPPRDSGVRDNAGLRPAGLDNLAAQVRAQGRSAVHLGDDVDWWLRLFHSDWSYGEVSRQPKFLSRAAELLPGADFAVLHLCEVDSVGHHLGAASIAYREAAMEEDRQLARLLEIWDGPVVVVADHGHVDEGGHGGEEPEVRKTWMVMAGPGIKHGVTLPDAPSLDIAPTVAALLGVPAPASAEGHVLVDALALDGPARQALERADQSRLARLTRDLGAARERFGRRDLAAGGARALAVIALLVLAVDVARRFPGAARWGLATGAAAALGTLAGQLLWWGPGSFSASSQMGWVVAEAAGLSGAVSVMLLGFARHRAPRTQTPGADVALGFMFAVGAIPFAALSFIAFGAFAPRLACQPSWFAAAPMVAYGAFVPAALLGFGVAIPGVARVWRGVFEPESARPLVDTRAAEGEPYIGS